MWIFPTMKTTNDYPPTIYAILNSYVNFDAEEQTKIKDLANAGRGCIFDFNYPLSDEISKEEFETNILNHYMMRRIGFDTPTAFKIALNAKLNEIMPKYNKLFDAFANWNILEDGESVTRYKNINTSSHATNQTTDYSANDMRSSDTPEGKLSNVRDASYVTNYGYNQINSNGNSINDATGATGESETITRTPADKIRVYNDFVEQVNNIYSYIYKELDLLFYSLL